MKAIEILQQYWEQLARLLTYAKYCAGQDVSAIVCRDFWLWTVYAAVGLGLIIVFIIGRKAVKEQLEFYRNRKRLEAQRIADEDAAAELARWRVEASPVTELSQDELAAAFRQGIKARAEAGPADVSPRVAGGSRTSSIRELGTVMRDLATTIKEAVSTRALVPAADSPDGQAAATSEAEPRRELATIMLTDMVGYSGSMERDEQQAYAKLVEHNGIVRTAIRNYRGREIKTIGDAFLVIFRSALDGVDCALAIQRAFAEYNVDKDDSDKILLRIGIHLGDILITHNDVFGEGVNIVARIQPLAEPGGICVSEAVYIHVRKKFELKVERVEGVDLKLKNIAVAPDIYHLNLS